jgi:hypothetical protein
LDGQYVSGRLGAVSVMRVRFGMLFRCVGERIYVAASKNFASLICPAFSNRRFLNVVSVNADAFDSAIA